MSRHKGLKMNGYIHSCQIDIFIMKEWLHFTQTSQTKFVATSSVK